MDSLPLFLVPIPVPIFVAIYVAYVAHTQQKEQERLYSLIARLESLSGESRPRLRQLRRLSRLNPYANMQAFRMFGREISSVERNNGIYASYRLRRLTLAVAQILENFESRIMEIERDLPASR